MVDPNGFSVRPPQSSEEVKSLWWPSMQSLGWNRSDKDHATHWHSSRGNYLVLTHREATSSTSEGKGKKDEAEEEETEKPVGLILPVTFPNKTGWIGFFVVDAAYRGTGNGGRILFQAALDEFARRGTARVGLDGVLQQVGTYSRRGFVEKGRVKLMVTGKVKALMVPDPEEDGDQGGDGRLAAAMAAAAEVEEAEVQKVEAGVVGRPALKALDEVRPAALVEADERVSGLRRADLWTTELLVGREDVWGFAVEGGDGDGGVLGFVLVRSCEQGYRVGPLYAPTPGWAKALLVQVMQAIKGFGSVAAEKSLVAEVWGENPEAVKAFEKVGWEYSGVDYARMWLNGEETDAQKKGGVAEKEAFAWFDAGEG